MILDLFFSFFIFIIILIFEQLFIYTTTKTKIDQDDNIYCEIL